MRIENELRLNFDDVMLRPKRSTLKSRKDVSLDRTYTFVHSKSHFTGIPIIACNMDTVGTIDAARVMQEHNMMTWLHKFNDIELVTKSMFIGQLNKDFVAPSIGEKYVDQDFSYFKYIRIDVANGYRECFIDFIKFFRERFPHITIFAGNVCTPEITEELILSGADCVVVGIGSGGQCTTRTKAGVGYPQVSAVVECADAAHGLKGHIVSDGGCRTPADVVKAFAAGADFVALGSMLAAHNENVDEDDLEFDERTNQYFTTVYGMSSTNAMEKYYGGVDDHRTSEGTETRMRIKGPLKNTLQDILGGLRSACSYVGATELKELSKRTTFIRTNEIRNTYWERNV